MRCFKLASIHRCHLLTLHSILGRVTSQVQIFVYVLQVDTSIEILPVLFSDFAMHLQFGAELKVERLILVVSKYLLCRHKDEY